MTENLDTDTVNKLIAEKRYEEAKTLLRGSSDPGARAWLAKLEQTFPTSTPTRSLSSYKSQESGTTENNTSTSRGCMATLGALGSILSSIITCVTAAPETRVAMVGVVVVIVAIVLFFVIFTQRD